MAPLVSIVMAVYNDKAYVEQALSSVLAQTWPHFELIVVDDCSQDGSGAIVEAWARRDARIRLLRNPENLGLTRSLNRALDVAQGPLIARQDADDVSLPERLQKQVEFMQAHPETVLLGTACTVIDDAGRAGLTIEFPAEDAEIRWHLLFRNPFGHTAAMFRAVLSDGTPVRYDERFRYSQDLELWTRLAAAGRMANRPEALVQRREHARKITHLHAAAQDGYGAELTQAQLARYFPAMKFKPAEIETLRRSLMGLPRPATVEQMRTCRRYFDLLDALERHPEFGAAAIPPLRRKLIHQLLLSLPLASWGGLLRSGLLWRIMQADPAGLIAHGARRLRRRCGGERP